MALALHGRHELDPDDLRPLEARGTHPNTLLLIGAIAAFAVAVFQALVVEEGVRRFMLAYVVAFAFILSLSLGGIFFVLIQHLARAGWSVSVRRPAEVLSANVGIVAIFFLPIAVSVLAGGAELYPWATYEDPPAHHAAHEADHHEDVTAPAQTPTDGGLMSEDALRPQVMPTTPESADGPRRLVEGEAPISRDLRAEFPGQFTKRGSGAEDVDRRHHRHFDEFIAGKRPYLSPVTFVGRWILFLAFWIGLGLWFWRSSTRQDRTGDARLTARLEKWTGPCALLFALTLTFAAFDLIMSLNPYWYSTIFPVYYFAGSVVASLALLILLLMFMQARGYLREAVSRDHYHDLGKLMFAFVMFWAYIAFSQYMLEWYANIGEMLGWYSYHGMTTVSENVNLWSYVILALLFGHFIIPFAGLMSRKVKRSKPLLAFWSVWLLIAHFVDLTWLVMPEFSDWIYVPLIEIGLTVALLCLYLTGVLWLLSKSSVIPAKDPRLPEALAYQNV